MFGRLVGGGEVVAAFQRVGVVVAEHPLAVGDYRTALLNRQAGGTEGEIFLADASVASDASGRAAFALTLHSAVPASFTATATSSEGGTSEFSEPVALAE